LKGKIKLESRSGIKWFRFIHFELKLKGNIKKGIEKWN